MPFETPRQAARPHHEKTPSRRPATAASTPVAGMTHAGILQMQKTMGNQAVMNILQRKVTITGENKDKKIGPSSKYANMLWEDVKLALYSAGISPYGLKTKYFAKLLKDDTDRVFTDQDTFITTFVQEMTSIYQKETQAGTKKRTVRDAKVMASRPGWPSSYKQQLGFQPGDNIRHIVRNNTLKTALKRELEHAKATKSEHEITEYFSEMASQLGVSKEEHYIPLINGIYSKLYLHLGNLFAASGGVNQAIGLAADPILNLAQEMEALGDQRVDIHTVIKRLRQCVDTALQKTLKNTTKMSAATKSHFVKGLDEYVKNLESFYEQLAEYWFKEYAYDGDPDKGEDYADAEDLADDVYDFGDNLGFDLIVGDSADGMDVAKRQNTLLEVETALQKYSPGGGISLTDIFKVFLSAQ